MVMSIGNIQEFLDKRFCGKEVHKFPFIHFSIRDKIILSGFLVRILSTLTVLVHFSIRNKIILSGFLVGILSTLTVLVRIGGAVRESLSLNII